MKHLFLLILSGLFVPVYAAEAPETPGLLPTPIVLNLIDQDPGVMAARAGLEVARQEANILERSPYEWNARLTGQRRTVQNGPDYREWNVGLERTVRLPGKAKADRNIGKATVDEADARYANARHEAARDLLTMWLEWLQADAGYGLAQSNGRAAEGNLGAVQKRVRAGDAARLDAGLALAELAEQRRLTSEAKTQAAVAWARLHGRFPGFDRQLAAMPTVSPLQRDAQYWRLRIREQSDELKAAEAQWRTASGQAERARAEKTPDPTFGLFTASEVGGRERLVGISINIPIPGGHRNERAIQATQTAEMKRQEAERVRRQLEADIESALATVMGSYESMQIAEAGSSAMQDNARLMQRAYTLGESDLQSLLTAQKQATAAQQNALSAKTAALKSFYVLLIDSHLVWDLAHE